MLVSAPLVALALVCAESAFRSRAPEHAARPSTALARCASAVRRAALVVGTWIARLSDLFYVLHEVLGRDVVAVGRALYELVESPLYAVVGYVRYYYDSNGGMATSVAVLLTLACAAVLGGARALDDDAPRVAATIVAWWHSHYAVVVVGACAVSGHCALDRSRVRATN